jgi:CBS domain-containing protein
MSLLVRHAMSTEPKTAGSDMNAADAAALMRSYDIGVVPVVDGARLVGIVTDRDIVTRVVANRADPLTTRLGDILTKDVVTVSPDARLSDARESMAEHRIRRLAVTKDGDLVGMLSMGDVAVIDSSKRAVGEALEDVSESPSTLSQNLDGPKRGTPDRVRTGRGS